MALASPALAVDLPSYFALPEGVTATALDYQNYDWIEIEHNKIEPRGHRWHVTFPVAKGAKPSVIEGALRAKGWELLRTEPTVLAHHAQPEAWAKSSVPGVVYVVETSTARKVDLAPPGNEELRKNEDAPFFPPFPGLKLYHWEHRDDAGCAVRNPVIKDLLYVGPPSTRFTYTGPKDQISGLEMQESYSDALGRAGWDVVAPGIAHYAKKGQDLWLQFGAMDGYLTMCIADVAAASAAANLKRALDELGHVALYGIYFDLDKATLRPEAESTLAQIRALLQKYPTLKLEIQGHTDNSGTHEHNQSLSEQRAASVKAWLVAHAIDTARLTTAGFAETKPVASNTTLEGKQKNRRVELAKR
jgi:outer membrane protein OmpA-like peptidoglycan-associated protein